MVNDVNSYLVNSKFLLGRKGFSENEEIPRHVIKLRTLEDEVKEIIADIQKYTLEKPSSEACEEKRDHVESKKKRKKRDKDEKRKKITMESDSNEGEEVRSRSRDKVQKKKERKLE